MNRTKRLLTILLLIGVIMALGWVVERKYPISELRLPKPLPTTSVTPAALGQTTETSRVIRVIDGDTIEIEGNVKVRYIGIDTPETSDPRKPVQCFGLAATVKNRELVEGKSVRLEKDISETDRFGRLLRYVYINDGMVNQILVSEGFAKAAAFPPDIKHQETFRLAEIEAREANKGLWGECQP